MATASRSRKATDEAVETTRDAAQEAVAQSEATIDEVGNTAREVVERTTNEAAATFEQSQKVMQEQLSKAQEIFGQYGPLSREAAELLAEARKRVHEGVVEFNTEVLSFTQGTVNESFETTKAVVAAGSLQEALSIQSAFVRKLFEQSVEEAKKLTEMAGETNREVFKPVSKGWTEAIEKLRAAA